MTDNRLTELENKLRGGFKKAGAMVDRLLGTERRTEHAHARPTQPTNTTVVTARLCVCDGCHPNVTGGQYRRESEPMKNTPVVAKKPEKATILARIAGFFGIGSLVTSIWFGTILPLLAFGAAIFAILSFTNGLS